MAGCKAPPALSTGHRNLTWRWEVTPLTLNRDDCIFENGFAHRQAALPLSRTSLMLKQDILLAALASSRGTAYSPIQIQKLLFLVDRRMGRDIGGPFFDFIPYSYGPFDRSIYDLLTLLIRKGLVAEVDVPGENWKLYRPTSSGQVKGEQALACIPAKLSSYLGQLSSYVVKLSFRDLVSEIYRAYPEMQVNTVFKVRR